MLKMQLIASVSLGQTGV